MGGQGTQVDKLKKNFPDRHCPQKESDPYPRLIRPQVLVTQASLWQSLTKRHLLAHGRCTGITVSGIQRGFWGTKLRFSGMYGKGFYPTSHHGSPRAAFEIGPGGTARPHIIPALGRLEARAQSGLCTKKKGNEREKSFHMLKRWLATSKTAQKWAGHQKDWAWLEGWDCVPHTSLSLRGKS